jgi:hypothetical protein
MDAMLARPRVAPQDHLSHGDCLEVLHAQLMAGAFKMASVLFRLSPSSKLLGSTFYADAAWDKVVFLSGEATIQKVDAVLSGPSYNRHAKALRKVDARHLIGLHQDNLAYIGRRASSSWCC